MRRTHTVKDILCAMKPWGLEKKREEQVNNNEVNSLSFEKRFGFGDHKHSTPPFNPVVTPLAFKMQRMDRIQAVHRIELNE